jgi:hypothetical protein
MKIDLAPENPTLPLNCVRRKTTGPAWVFTTWMPTSNP